MLSGVMRKPAAGSGPAALQTLSGGGFFSYYFSVPLGLAPYCSGREKCWAEVFSPNFPASASKLLNGNFHSEGCGGHLARPGEPPRSSVIKGVLGRQLGMQLRLGSSL